MSWQREFFRVAAFWLAARLHQLETDDSGVLEMIWEMDAAIEMTIILEEEQSGRTK